MSPCTVRLLAPGSRFIVSLTRSVTSQPGHYVGFRNISFNQSLKPTRSTGCFLLTGYKSDQLFHAKWSASNVTAVKFINQLKNQRIHGVLIRGQLPTDNFNFNDATCRQSSFVPQCLVTVVAALMYVLFNKDDVNQDNLSILSYLKNAFSVSAAKPFNNSNNDDMNKIGVDQSNDKVKTLNRRTTFNFIADVVESVKDAVVCIEVHNHSDVNWHGVPQSSSNGSGFIVSPDGIILTNAHVVAVGQSSSISVKLDDGRCFAGHVEDVDYESDLATVRINARGLPTMRLGCSAETRIGEWVVAMGSPLNLSKTVTAGIVSTTQRGANELGIKVNDINYIQTDAAITFGNSGGPLINLDGEAIGINSMKVTSGISFAIPIDHAKKFLQISENAKRSGKPRFNQRYLGVTLLTLTEQLRSELDARTGAQCTNHGALVWQVAYGSPAFLAGMKPGDVIISVNDQNINSAIEVHELVKTHAELIIKFQRGAKIYNVKVIPQNVHQ